MRPVLKDQVNYWSGKITWKESAEGCMLGIKSLRNLVDSWAPEAWRESGFSNIQKGKEQSEKPRRLSYLKNISRTRDNGIISKLCEMKL